MVAGASRGLGLAIARGLAAAGAHTILAARSEKALKDNAAAIRAAGGNAEAVVLDVSDPESIRAVAEPRSDIDILVNVSGTNLRKPFPEYTREEYDSVLQTNLHGLWQLTQIIGGNMVDRGKGGKVIFIGSLMSVAGLPYLTLYGTSKAALAGLTRSLAAEWGRYGIQVNCIAPGFIITDLNRQVWSDQKMLDWLKGVQAIPHTGTPEDVANLAVFLSGPGSDYITGQVIAVDGGYTTTAVWPFAPAGATS